MPAAAERCRGPRAPPRPFQPPAPLPTQPHLGQLPRDRSEPGPHVAQPEPGPAREVGLGRGPERAEVAARQLGERRVAVERRAARRSSRGAARGTSARRDPAPGRRCRSSPRRSRRACACSCRARCRGRRIRSASSPRSSGPSFASAWRNAFSARSWSRGSMPELLEPAARPALDPGARTGAASRPRRRSRSGASSCASPRCAAATAPRCGPDRRRWPSASRRGRGTPAGPRARPGPVRHRSRARHRPGASGRRGGAGAAPLRGGGRARGGSVGSCSARRGKLSGEGQRDAVTG